MLVRCKHCLKKDDADNMWCIISSSSATRYYECKTKCKRAFDTTLNSTIDSMKESAPSPDVEKNPLNTFWNWMKFINKKS